MTDQPYDIVGTEIKIGDWVVYGISSERATLLIGQVSKIIPKLVQGYAPYDWKTRTYGPKPDPHIEFKIQVSKTEQYQDYQDKMWKTVTKKKTLDSPKRFCVIPKPQGVGPEESGMVVD